MQERQRGPVGYRHSAHRPEIAIGEGELRAFRDVAAAEAKMLFESHVFYRMLGKGAKRSERLLMERRDVEKKGRTQPRASVQEQPGNTSPAGCGNKS